MSIENRHLRQPAMSALVETSEANRRDMLNSFDLAMIALNNARTSTSPAANPELVINRLSKLFTRLLNIGQLQLSYPEDGGKIEDVSPFSFEVGVLRGLAQLESTKTRNLDPLVFPNDGGMMLDISVEEFEVGVFRDLSRLP